MPNVHTDTVSAFLDDDALVLQSKVDMDVTGDGVVDMHARIDPATHLFHLADSARTTIPDIAAYSFLGPAGREVWLAPQTQDPSLIWPGFSTEDPSLSGKVAGNRLSVTMTDVVGPGDVQLYLQDGLSVRRTFSSTDELPAWTITVPQHVHMNWAFTRPGTYEIDFQVSGVVDGRAQTASQTYVFVVGNVDDHTSGTSVILSASAVVIDPDEPFLLTASMSPDDAVGAVQFRDLTTGNILGHGPVVDGFAAFRVDGLTPGSHRLEAEFVPTWSTDFHGARSDPVEVRVTGEAVPAPTEPDTVAVPTAELSAHDPGTTVRLTAADGGVQPGGEVTARVTESSVAGAWVSVWVHKGASATWLGWIQTTPGGGVTVTVPDDAAPGSYRLVVKSRSGSLVGWDSFTVLGTSSGGGPVAPVPSPPAAQPAPAAPAEAARQQCQPGLTLSSGHIDAFYVSAADGRAVLQLMEDVTGYRVIREPEQVLLQVKASAYRSNIPAGTPGAPSGYVLPLTQNASLLWPGWDTNRTAASGYTDVSINILSVDGPGRVFLSSQGSFGNVQSLLQSGGYTLPGTIREETPAHTHAQWVFSAKGIYTLRVNAVATDPSSGASVRTATRTYTFQVGDAALGDTFCSLAPVATAEAAAVNAAVDEAAADAVAAEQAAAEAAAEAAEAERLRQQAEQEARGEAAAEASSENAVVAEGSAGLLFGIVGGGVLVVAGIVGVTIYAVRRMNSVPPAT